MSPRELLIAEIMIMVSSARDQRMRLRRLLEDLSVKLNVPLSTVNRVIEGLVENEKLVLTYRKSFNYVEIPFAERAPNTRSKKVVIDDRGEPWICDVGVDPSMDLDRQGAWRCRDLPGSNDVRGKGKTRPGSDENTDCRWKY